MLWAVFAREGEGSSLLINLIPMLEQTEEKKLLAGQCPALTLLVRVRKIVFFCGKKALYVFITQMVF